jgi:hypothetical protein
MMEYRPVGWVEPAIPIDMRVGWMTLFSSTITIGGWVKRYPPYGLLRSPDAIRGRTSRCLGTIPGFHPGYGYASPDQVVAL